MSASMALLDLVGGVAILLWGLRMVRTAASRGLGGKLRLLLSRATRSRLEAFLFGAGASCMLQSSTAAILLVSSFVGKGFVTLPAALAVALGADLGTAVAAQILRFDLGFVAPAAALLGYSLFQLSGRKQVKNAGRALLGLAFILLALKLIMAASAPMRSSETLVALMAALASEPILAVLLAAALTWFSHSSLAVVLLIVALTTAEAVEGPLALTFILGANFGAALPAVVATATAAPPERRVAVGNLLFRTCGVVILMPFVPAIHEGFLRADLSPGAAAASQHFVFNLLLGLVALPLTGIIARLLKRLVVDLPLSQLELHQRRGPRYLEDAAQLSPERAIANAQREALRMADLVYDMVELSLATFRSKSIGVEITTISTIDDQVDQFNNSIKFYIADIARKELSIEESRRCMMVFSFVTNMEHIGDIVDANVLRLAERMRKGHLSFSDEGEAEIAELHARVIANMKTAMTAFMSSDEELAEYLIGEKQAFRDLDRDSTQRHLERLRLGNADSIETSAIHVDLLRDLKRINFHATAIAYSIVNAPLVSSRHVA